MSGDFLYNLGTILQQQFNLSDNQIHSLNTDDGAGGTTRYGLLGDFANKFDQSSERTYLEQGYTKHSMLPKAFEIIMQEPNVTVLIKKKQFSSLKVHNKIEYMDAHEKIFMRASAVLFQNKCNQIAAYEKLSKLERISQLDNQTAPNLLGMIIDQVDAINAAGSALNISANTNKVITALRRLYSFNRINPVTTWISDNKAIKSVGIGSGTGVIELNMVTTVNTSTSIRWQSGSCNFTVEDPYELMIINNADIDRAISDSLNPYFQSKIFQLGQDSLTSIIDRKTRILNDRRLNRRVNPIVFKVNPDTFLGKRVSIIIDGIGEEIIYDPGSLQDQVGQIFGQNNPQDGFDASAMSPDGAFGKQGLNAAEAGDVADIVTAIYSRIAADTNIRNQRFKSNQDNNYLRTKMRLHYANKPLIQPMDVVHVWIESKSRTDPKVSAGLTNFVTGFGFMEKLSKDVSNIKDSFSNFFNPSNDITKIEKDLYAGPDFPNFLWTLLRPYFINDRAGAHVFAGLVDSATATYSNGKFLLSVQCKDNSGYFKMGRVNLVPALENFNAPLYDPVTPFDISFDTLTGRPKSNIPRLLPENIKLIQQNTAKYNAGPNKGLVCREENFFGQDSDQKLKTAAIQQVYYTPGNMVYRWKDGIACLTQATTTGTNAALFGTIQRQNVVKQTGDPFAGQDIMNVLSILVCAEPHNFATFYKNAIQFDSFSATRQETSYYTNLLSDIKKNNVLYGQFLPIKNLVYSEENLSYALMSQASIIEKSSTLDDYLQARAALRDQFYGLNAQVVKITDQNLVNPALQTIKTKIAELDDHIEKLQSILSTELHKAGRNQISGGIADRYYNIQGDDISFDQNSFISPGVSGTDLTKASTAREQFRQKLNKLTRRPLHRVKANDDTNLLIIDDTYDKDLDLQAFSQALGGANSFSTFVNDYRDTSDTIAAVAKLLDLEVFCDTQGHIRIRPPQYNRIPSSVFYKMIGMKEQLGVRVYPQFIENLYKTQVQSTLDNISILEDEIRLRGVALGKVSDEVLQSFIKANNAPFLFLSNETTGQITDIPGLFSQSNPDTLEKLNNIQATLERSAKSSGQVFTVLDRLNILNDIDKETSDLIAFGQTGPGAAVTILRSRYDTVADHLFQKTGIRPVQLESLVPNSSRLGTATGISEVDAYRITKEIATLIAKRQNQIKLAASAIKNIQSAINFDQNSTTQQQASFPALYGNKNVPELLRSMIEDESFDDYGPNSGKRYVIQNKHILTYNVTETPPDFTMVEVNGLLGGGLVNVDDSLRLTNQGGNALVSAFAVDYDLWRLYGFRASQPFPVPFFSDPEAQCAPFAVSILNRARGQVLHATASVIGNEFYQPGEVYYFEPRDLLFYTDSVSHSFTYGISFTTSLTLSYGHNAGEYIPTPFDLIGKTLFKKRDQVDNIVIKNPIGINEIPAGVIFRLGSGNSVHLNSGNADEPFESQENANTLQNATISLISALNPNSLTTSKPTQLELRVYYNSSRGIAVDTDVVAARAKIFDKLVNNQTFALPANAINVVNIDLGDSKESRNPSPLAWSTVRDLSTRSNLETVLATNVIDLWVVNV